jgi:hypothetical protein
MGMSLMGISMCWRVRHRWRPVRKNSCTDFLSRWWYASNILHTIQGIVLPLQHPASDPLLQIWKRWKGRITLAWLPRNRHTMHPDIFESIGKRSACEFQCQKMWIIKKQKLVMSNCTPQDASLLILFFSSSVGWKVSPSYTSSLF